MSNPYHLVVFDWEGTISDNLGQILHTLVDEADKLGFGKIDLWSANKYVNLGLIQLIRKLVPQLSNMQQGQLIQAVQLSLISQPAEVWLIPGVLDLIKQLHAAKIDLAIATNKGHQSLQRALQMTGLDHWIKVTRSAGQVPAKPCPQMLEEIMAEFGRDASSTLMIGDSALDMEMAHAIHVDAIGVDLYNQHEAELKSAGAMEVFNSYNQLAEFLKNCTR